MTKPLGSASTWSPERAAKYRATMAKKHGPVPVKQCSTCPSLLTRVDIRNGCVRCANCRRRAWNTIKPRAPLVALNPEPKTGRGSWWLCAPDVFYDKARDQFKDMASSEIAKKMGYRTSLDDACLKRAMRRAS